MSPHDWKLMPVGFGIYGSRCAKCGIRNSADVDPVCSVSSDAGNPEQINTDTLEEVRQSIPTILDVLDWQENLLRGRDQFIVEHGLWEEFCAWVSEQRKNPPTPSGAS